MRVAVIGGGPSGLVTLKYLTTAHEFLPIEPIEAMLFESASKIGGIFFHHTYEEGEMVSSKYLTTFSDHRPRPGDPDFFPTGRYLEYLSDYCTKFGLWPHIRLSTPVASVKRRGINGHVVTYHTPEGKEFDWDCDAIAVCCGLHSVPTIPELKGVENVPVVMHSEKFKTRSQFGTDQTVMVLGSGETAADICELAMTSPTKKVVMCHRDGWVGAPRKMFNAWMFPKLRGISMEGEAFPGNPMPIDVCQGTLFDSMYVHPQVRDSMWIWGHYDIVALKGAWAATGSFIGYEQTIGARPEHRLHASKVLFNKAWEKVYPYISPRYRDPNPSRAERIRQQICDCPRPDPGRYVDLAPFPDYIDDNGVAHFSDNGRPEYEMIQDQIIKPDVLIFATGYTQKFPFFSVPENKERPYPTNANADVRDIWKTDDPTVGFIGFVRPAFGAIPSLSEFQAMLWILNLTGRVTKPLLKDDEYHYRILTPPNSRIRYGVEHESYAYQLAKDMDAAPTFSEILTVGLGRGNGAWYKVPWLWAGGNHFVAKFRLKGPWKWDGAVDVMTGDLWETVSRRVAPFGNITLVFLPICYLGALSLFYWVYFEFFNLLAKVGLSEPVVKVNYLKQIWEEGDELEKKAMQEKAMKEKMLGKTNM